MKILNVEQSRFVPVLAISKDIIKFTDNWFFENETIISKEGIEIKIIKPLKDNQYTYETLKGNPLDKDNLSFKVKR